MKSTEGTTGRVFILRLEDGDIVPDCLERFAAEEGISHALVTLVGGLGGGQVVVGPRKTDEMPPDPMLVPVDGAHEVHASGVLAPDKDGKPVLHIHGSLGRGGRTLTGCLRNGVETWLVAEAVIVEILDASARRLPDSESGFTLLDIP